MSERGIVVLRINGGLRLEDRRQFSSLCNQLMRSEMLKKVIDLSRATGIFSVYYGTLVDLCQRAEEACTPITVLVNDRIEDLLIKAGLQEVLTMVKVEVPVTH
ncbi:MAG: hypothetical protein ACYTGH_01715 [Planctomycetota bacterium]